MIFSGKPFWMPKRLSGKDPETKQDLRAAGPPLGGLITNYSAEMYLSMIA
jgi:hypothetical protein